MSHNVQRAGAIVGPLKPSQCLSGGPSGRADRLGWLALLGPAFAVSIGYIDPGNWATDLAASAYGYKLLWVVLAASAMALILQLGSARLAIASGEDLASLISARWPRAAPALGALFESAIIATDVAEFAGIVVGTQLIFHLSITFAALIAIAAVSAIFLLNTGRLRRLEFMLIAMLWLVAIAVLWQLWGISPPINAIASGALTPRLPDHAAVLIAIGLIGATVMPHNLFLHSALIKEKCAGEPEAARERYGRFYTAETFWALIIATVINAAILIVAANYNRTGVSFERLYMLIGLHAGVVGAVVFGSALTISGLASSVTATLSSDYVVAAFSPFQMRPITRRMLAAVPAAALLIAGVNPMSLMLWSQAVLAAILPTVIVPLIVIMSSMRVAIPRFSRKWIAASAAAAAICIAFDTAFLILMMTA